MRGMGFIPTGVMAYSGSGGPVGLAIGAAISVGLMILSRLHIGSGRKEADAITPVANSLVNPQRTGRLDEIVDERDSTANVTTLQNLAAELDQLEQAYDQFLSDPRFTDGRAVQQARGDMFPLMDQIRQEIIDKLLGLGGELPPPQLTQGYGSMVPALRYPLQTFPWIPQAGTLPPVAPLSPLRSQPPETIMAGFGDLLPLLLIGGLAFTVMRRR